MLDGVREGRGRCDGGLGASRPLAVTRRSVLTLPGAYFTCISLETDFTPLTALATLLLRLAYQRSK